MDWLRLWHDMPNDPKWETIARKCGDHISLVIAMYVHMLVDASRNVTRGHVTVTNEDLASALNVTDDQVSAVLSAMEGRVIANGYLLGWEKRQPKREDSGNPETGAKSAAQRKAEQRERERLARLSAQTPPSVTPGHDASRNVTTEEIREDEIRLEEKNTNTAPPPVDNSVPVGTSVDPVFVFLEDQGIQNLNPNDPEFTRLKSGGADLGYWEHAASVAVGTQNLGFAYVLGIVRNQLAKSKQGSSTVPARKGTDPALAKLDADKAVTKPPSESMRLELAALKAKTWNERQQKTLSQGSAHAAQ